MFRCFQRYIPAPCSVGLESHAVVNEDNGFVERRKRSTAAPLPDPRLFDPTTCIKAGKNLQQVHSQVFGAFPESFSVSPAEPPITPPVENNNEPEST